MRISYRFIIFATIISIVIAFLVYFYTSFYLFKGFDKALEGVLLFSSISVGFYGACLSVIASIFNTKVVKDIMKDKGDKREFLILASTTLIIGFLTVVFTILYQVLIANGNIPKVILDLISAVWSGSVVMFISMNVIFIFLSFLIFFSNKEENEDGQNKENEYQPTLKTSPFRRRK